MTRGSRTRQAVLDCIVRSPGIHKSELQRQLGLGWGTVSYHLDVLRRDGRVKMMERGRQVALFATDVPDEHMRWLAALRSDVPNGILHHLAQRPQARIEEMVVDLGLPRRIVRRHLRDLAQQGLVSEPQGLLRNRFSLEDAATLDGLGAPRRQVQGRAQGEGKELRDGDGEPQDGAGSGPGVVGEGPRDPPATA